MADRYGGPEVVHVVDVPMPKLRKGEVLVRVHAAAVTSGDARIRGARFPTGFGVPARLAFGITRPRRPILGSTFSGVVERVAVSEGSQAATFATGDEVCGMTGAKMGAHAEYLAIRASRLAHKPRAVTHDDAAGVLFGGSAALFFLRDKASVGPGRSVFINGASGAVGTNAVQLAKHFGATVTAMTSAANAALITKLGADHIMDYAQQHVDAITDRYDIVFDTVGTLSIASGRRLLRAGGVLVLAVASLGQTIRARGNLVAGSAPERVADFDLLLELVDEGTLAVVHDQRYDLDHIADAHRRVDSGHKVGNVVVAIV